MPTEKPRVTFTISKERLSELETYQHDNKIKNQTQAILSLIEKGLSDFEPTKKAPSLPDEAMRIAKDYTHLDYHGKRMVQIVVDEEKDRMKEEIKRAREAAQDRDDGPKVINLFVEPSAAGIAVPTMGVDYEIYELKPEDPPGAAYAVRLQGNSMEPDFPDGSIVFVNHDALRDGDVGIFSIDGGTVCKQYHQEGGIVYLFSLNRRRADADLVLFPGGNRSFVCQGRVMTRRRYPVPGRG